MPRAHASRRLRARLRLRLRLTGDAHLTPYSLTLTQVSCGPVTDPSSADASFSCVRHTHSAHHRLDRPAEMDIYLASDGGIVKVEHALSDYDSYVPEP